MEIPFPLQEKVSSDLRKPISPMEEMVAYEVMWRDKKMTFKQLSRIFASRPGKLPSDLVPREYIESLYSTVEEAALKCRANLLIHGSVDYPARLRQAEEPVEVLYYTGNIDLLSTRSIAVVGTRKPSEDGLRLATEVARFLVSHDFTIVSGLAAGIDTAAHTAAIGAGGRTIAVIGTPLDYAYPEENKDLQLRIALEHLLVTQVPFIRYREQSIKGNRLFFPERNKTMSALSEATVIVEAGETSGTLIQARAALYQKRKLFILEHCFENPRIGWPAEYLAQGAIRVRNFEDILQ